MMRLLPWAFIAHISTACASGICPGDYKEYERKCYTKFEADQPLTQREALEFCMAREGRLSLINQNTISFLQGEYVFSSFLTWLSLSDELQEGSWVTLEGESVSMAELTWDAAEPNGGIIENAGAINPVSRKYVDAPVDLKCGGCIDIVCQTLPDKIRSVKMYPVQGRHIPEDIWKNITTSNPIECSKECIQHYPYCVSIAYRKETPDNCVLSKTGTFPLFDNPPTQGGWTFYNMKVL